MWATWWFVVSSLALIIACIWQAVCDGLRERKVLMTAAARGEHEEKIPHWCKRASNPLTTWRPSRLVVKRVWIRWKWITLSPVWAPCWRCSLSVDSIWQLFGCPMGPSSHLVRSCVSSTSHPWTSGSCARRWRCWGSCIPHADNEDEDPPVGQPELLRPVLRHHCLHHHLLVRGDAAGAQAQMQQAADAPVHRLRSERNGPQQGGVQLGDWGWQVPVPTVSHRHLVLVRGEHPRWK